VGVASKVFDLALIDKAQDLISLNQNLIDFSQKYDRAIFAETGFMATVFYLSRHQGRLELVI